MLLIGREKPDSTSLKPQPFHQIRLRCLFHKGKLFYLEYQIRLLVFLLFHEFDIHLAVDLDTLLPNQIAAGIRGRKLVFDAHEYFTEVPELQGRGLSKMIWEWVAKIGIPSADAAYTVGPKLAGLFTSIYRRPFQYILNVPEKKENPVGVTPPLYPPIILYQGALNAGRGLEVLIEAMQDLNACLWIAGEGDLSEELRKQVIMMGLESKVQFLGWVHPAELPEITRKAKIGINILEPKGLSYQYSLANKFFDYIHAGLPQLCADFLEYETINKQFEVAVLCPCELKPVQEGLKRLLVDVDLYKRLQQNCLRAKEQYHLQIQSVVLLAIFRSL